MSTTEYTITEDKEKEKEKEKKKKKETPNETYNSITSNDFKKFIINYLLSIIFTIGITVFIIGTLGLYTTKVAQSNILPDDISLAPYTYYDRIVTDQKIDINIIKPSFFSGNNDTLSQKAIFKSQKYLDSFDSGFLCFFKKNAKTPNEGLFANASLFFSSVYNNIVAKNFMVINTIFYYLSYLPESVIMLIYGFFGIFLWIILYYFNICISIFYHIISIPELFRNASYEFPEKWQSTDKISFFSLKLVLFCFIWWWIGLISIFITPAFFTNYAFLSPLFAKYKVTNLNSEKDKEMSIIDFIKNTFAYKQYFFIILATISLFFNGIIYLGFNSIIGIALAVVFAYFMGIYTNEIPTSADGFSNTLNKINPIMKVSEQKDNLVDICGRIIYENDNPPDNNFRELTKPNSVGDETQTQGPNVQNMKGGKKGKKYNIRFV